MSEQKKTRADVIAEIQKTNALLQRLLDVMSRTSTARNTRITLGGGTSDGAGTSGGGCSAAAL